MVNNDVYETVLSHEHTAWHRHCRLVITFIVIYVESGMLIMTTTDSDRIHKPNGSRAYPKFQLEMVTTTSSHTFPSLLSLFPFPLLFFFPSSLPVFSTNAAVECGECWNSPGRMHNLKKQFVRNFRERTSKSRCGVMQQNRVLGDVTSETC